jgi:hypothetical protein
MGYVYEVYCPKCNRVWTGEFETTTASKVVCRDCIAAGEGDAKESPDIHINPRG